MLSQHPKHSKQAPDQHNNNPYKSHRFRKVSMYRLLIGYIAMTTLILCLVLGFLSLLATVFQFPPLGLFASIAWTEITRLFPVLLSIIIALTMLESI